MKISEYRKLHLAPERWEPRVLFVVFNPVLEALGGVPLREHKRWHDPDRLAGEYIADLEACSDGRVRYRIVRRLEVDAHPVKVDGFRYTDDAVLEVFAHPARAHRPDTFDYPRLIREFDIIPQVEAGEIDEVWLMAYPWAGLWESTMAGRGAFFCNSDPVPDTGHCPRRFVIMGFNYERGVGEMLEDFGHRAESILSRVFRRHPPHENPWQQFCLHDRIAPGRAAVGSVHFAPNSQRDYDWGNPRPVPSTCDDWLDYPLLSGERRIVDAFEWGGGDIRAHHRWWLKHLPSVTGETHGVSNDWWQYVVDPNRVA